MRALSLWQPHGSLLVTGAKPFETRHWPTKITGDILLHVAQRKIKSELEYYLGDPDYQMGLAPLLGLRLQFESEPEKFVTINDLPFGAFIGIGELVCCIPTEKMTPAQIQEARCFGDFSDGRFAWEFRNVRRFKNPIPAKGRQGFFFSAFDMTNNELIQVT